MNGGRDTSGERRDLEREVFLLRQYLDQVSRRLDWLAHRLNAIDGASFAAVPPKPAPQPAPQVIPTPAPQPAKPVSQPGDLIILPEAEEPPEEPSDSISGAWFGQRDERAPIFRGQGSGVGGQSAGDVSDRRALTPDPRPPTPAPRRTALTLERRIGVNWFVKIGIATMILGAGFFFQYAIKQGWIDKGMRCWIIAIAGIGLLTLGEWTLRRKWRIVSGAVTAGGLVLLYLAAFAAGPRYYRLIDRPVEFALMGAATAVAVALSLRSGLLSTAVMAALGAFGTPLLLDLGRNEQPTLMLYLLVVAAGFLVLATVKRWRALVPLVWAGSILLFAEWMARFYTVDQAGSSTLFAWLLWAVLMAQAAIGARLDRAAAPERRALSALAGPLMIVAILSIWSARSAEAALLQMVLTALVTLAAAWQLNWHVPRFLVWAAVAVGVYVFNERTRGWSEPVGPYRYFDAGWAAVWVLVPYLWTFGALFLADAWARTRRAAGERADSVVLAVATLFAVFGATYGLLRGHHAERMGLYALAFAAISLGLAAVFQRTRRPRGMALTFTFCAPVFAFLALVIHYPAVTAAVAILWAVLLIEVIVDLTRPDAAARVYRVLALLGVGTAAAAVVVQVLPSGAPAGPLAQAMLAAVLALAFAAWRGLHQPRPYVWALVACALGLPYAENAEGWRAVWVQVPWLWAFGALFLADVWLRSRDTARAAVTNVAVAVCTLGAVFGATYGLLRGDYDDWMGLYAALFALGSFGAAWASWRRGRRPELGYALFLAALAFVTVAVPIQFETHTITVAWAVQAVAGMVLARRLRNRTLLVMAFLVLILAAGWFVGRGGVDDAVLARTWFTWDRRDVPFTFLVALGLTAAAFGCAALVGWGIRWRTVLGRDQDRLMAGLLLWLGALIFLTTSAAWLPVRAAGWAWWALALGVAGAMRIRRSAVGTWNAVALLLIASVRWLVYDTLYRRLNPSGPGPALAGPMPATGWPPEAGLVVLNARFLLGLALAATVVWVGRGRGSGARGQVDTDKDIETPTPDPRPLTPALFLLAAFLPLWGGSFEVDRYVLGHLGDFENIRLARQMGFSILWAVYAGGLILTGFAVRQVALRYAAIVILAVTLVKVFLVDMSGVEAVYRILSFLALGAVLVGLSMVYQRYFARSAPGSPGARE